MSSSIAYLVTCMFFTCKCGKIEKRKNGKMEKRLALYLLSIIFYKLR